MVGWLSPVFAIMGGSHGTVDLRKAFGLGSASAVHSGLFRIHRAHALLRYRGK